MRSATHAIEAIGLRRSTSAARAALALADEYQGLGPGVTRWRLAAALRAAARLLGLSEGMLRLLEHYIDLSWDEDWDPGSEPVITRPLVEIAEHLGKSERQIRNIERALVDKGLLAWRDSGNHHRKGRRDRRSGRLVWAYGPSLAPLGRRASEILALAETARSDAAETRRLRIAISALRRRIRADLAAASDAKVDTTDLANQFSAIPDRNVAGVPHSALDIQRKQLQQLSEAIRGMLTREVRSGYEIKISGKPEADISHITDTCTDNAINGISITSKKVKHDRCVRTEISIRARKGGSDGGASLVPLAVAQAAAGPELYAATLEYGPPSWRGIVEAAHKIAPILGVDQKLWAEACIKLGRNGAGLAILVLERALLRDPSGATLPVARPSAWFKSLFERAADGRLHLDRSVRALAQKPAQHRDPIKSPPHTRPKR